MNNGTDDIDIQSGTISVLRIVLIQSMVTIVGFALLFGVCIKQFIRYQFSQIDDSTLQRLRAEQGKAAGQQMRFVEKDFNELLTRVCVSMPCIIEDIDLSVTADRLPVQSLRVITTIDTLDIPIFLDVFRAHPYGFTVEGLEVHAYEKPAKMQVRLSRFTLPDDIAAPNWIELIGWRDDEVEKLRTLYASRVTHEWQALMLMEKERTAVEWQQLYQTLSRDLWQLSQEETSLVYTRAMGTSIKGVK